MAFNYVELNEEKLFKSLGVKGKNQNGIRYYMVIDGINMRNYRGKVRKSYSRCD